MRREPSRTGRASRSRRRPADRPDSYAVRLATSGGFVFFLVLVGAALRSVQYFSRSSLWVDEAALALNLAARPFPELFRPLDLAQVGPWGFLAIEKGLLGLFGRSELGLRLLPFLASLGSLVLFERLCRRVLKGLAVPFAVAGFALGAGLIDYAAQLKQYATDVAAAVAIVLLALSLYDKGLTRRRAFLLGLAGLVACVFSQAVVFVLAGVGLSLVFLAAARKIEAPASALVVTGSLWLLGAGFVLWSGERMLTPEVGRYLRDFWASGFLPFPPPVTAPAAWLWNWTAIVFNGFLGFPLPLLFGALLVAGAAGLLRRHRVAALFLLTPLLLTVAASAARLYPFAPGRVTAFLVPGLLIFAAEGVERARTLPSRGLALVGAAVAAVAAACLVWGVARNPPPYMEEHVRPALERLRGQWRPGDALYVYYGVRLPYLFYAPVLDLPEREAVLGECARDNPRRYLEQLDTLRGRPRVWVLLAHDLFAEGPLIFGYLDRIGRPLESTDFRFPGSFSAVVLAAYDLSDPGRLAAAAPDAFPVPDPPKQALAGLPCAGTMGPIPARLRAR